MSRSANYEKDGYRIERLSPAWVEPVIGFLRDAYADHPLAGGSFDGEVGLARWRWLNDSEPVLLDGKPAVWICLQGERIVGHIGALPVDVARGDETVGMAWARDLIVAPSARGCGIGSRLMLTTVAAVERCSVLGHGDVFPLYRRLGFISMGRLPRFMKVRRRRDFAAAISRHTTARTIASLVIPVLQARPRAGRGGRRTIERLHGFGERFDHWWRSVEPALGCVARRTSSTMEWRYVHNPTRSYRILGASVHGDLRGVAVLRVGTSRGMRAGFLVELLAHPADKETIVSLIAAADEELGRAGEDVVFVRAGSLPGSFGRALIGMGYVPIPSPIHWILAGRHGPASLGGLLQRSDWYLNTGDSDIDFL